MVDLSWRDKVAAIVACDCCPLDEHAIALIVSWMQEQGYTVQESLDTRQTAMIYVLYDYTVWMATTQSQGRQVTVTGEHVLGVAGTRLRRASDRAVQKFIQRYGKIPSSDGLVARIALVGERFSVHLQEVRLDPDEVRIYVEKRG